MSAFTLKIVTPIGLVCEESVTQVLLPTTEGEVGILGSHENYVSTLGIGILRYDIEGKSESKGAVIREGFCSFENNTLVVLADAVLLPENIDRALYAADRDSLKRIVDSASGLSSEGIIAHKKLLEIEAIDTLFR